ncbi:PP2C family protein-serine/threonine phosphatase [Maribacter forsetii]|uniref:PP2C family protein-serine/threonine phosphatase n=1 Tax=Maribacter forsetii TaxID=444515 RepID=UPI00056D7854|nr:protein phosphatase 2C domain-containing protein [Maribacter forsetii]
MNYEIEIYTEKGPRKDNQDRIVAKILDEGYVAASIADGVGGNVHGDYAAEYANELFLDLIYSSKKRRLSQIFLEINKIVSNKANNNPEFKGMLTTLSSCVIGPKKLWFSHVGDTRIYVLNSTGVKRITEDHSEAYKLIREGKLKEEDLEFYPRKNVLTDAIGLERTPTIQSGTYSLSKNDVVLLTSDGVHGVVDDNVLNEIFEKSKSLLDLKKNLIKEIKISNPADNYSFILVKALQ